MSQHPNWSDIWPAQVRRPCCSSRFRPRDNRLTFARYGFIFAEQIGDDVTRDNLLKLIRLVGGLTGCQAVNGRAGLMRELIYISLLAGCASGLAAALDRGLFCSSLCHRCHSHGLCCLPAGELMARTLFNNPPFLAQPSGGGWRLRHPAPSDWATTFQTRNTRTCSILLRTSSRARQGISSHAARAFLDH